VFYGIFITFILTNDALLHLFFFLNSDKNDQVRECVQNLTRSHRWAMAA
jgi:hypothetical protein